MKHGGENHGIVALSGYVLSDQILSSNNSLLSFLISNSCSLYLLLLLPKPTLLVGMVYFFI
jgi:hypothetical protein